MKELGPINQDRLTTQPTHSKLKRGGDIFMAEGTGNGPEQGSPERITREDATRRLEELKRQTERPEEGASAPTPQEEMEEHAPEQKEFLGGIADLISKLGKSKDNDKITIQQLRALPNLREILYKIYEPADPEDKEKVQQELRDILKDDDDSSIGEKLGKLRDTNGIRRFAERVPGVDEYRINSIQQLCAVIAAKTNKELYGPHGEHPLLDEKGDFHPENLVLWVREQSVRLHEDNRNTEMSPLSAVVLSTGYRDISLYMMTRTNREQYFRDESGKVWDDLAEELVNEAFYFGVYRNTNLAYIQVMAQDEELPKALVQFHARNDLTNGDGLATMLSAPGDFSEKKTDTNVGDAIRIANDIYYNLSDQEELTEIFRDNPLRIEDIENALRIIQKKKDWSGDAEDEKLENFDSVDNNTPNELHYDASTRTLKGKYHKKDPETRENIVKDVNLLDGNNNVIMEEFVRFMNIYNYPTPLASRVDLLREIIRIKVAQKTGLRTGIALTVDEIAKKKKDYEKSVEEKGKEEADRKFLAKRKSEKININYAETSSYVMQRPIGAAAQNDTHRIGFDAATKLFIQDYLIRQSGEHTMGPIGIPEEIGIFKALSTDLWTGLRTESGDSPYEIFMRLREIDNTNLPPEEKIKLKKKQLDKLRFKERAESDYAGNQISRAFQIFHAQSGAEQLDLNKIVTYDPFQGIRYNPKEFEDQIKEKFIKPMRYALSSNSGLKYSSHVRIYDSKEKTYRPGLLAEKMLGPEVLEGIVTILRDTDGNPVGDYSYLDTAEGRREILKHAARTRIAAQIRFHRKFRSVGERWNYMRTETFIKALQTLNEYELDSDHPGKVKKSGESFFSEDDMRWIRQHSGSETWRMVMVDSIAEGGKNLPAGLFDAFTKFFQGLVKA